MKPSDCRKFQSCNASVCPLDTAPTVHLPGESACMYVLASGKVGAADRYGAEPVFVACVAKLPELAERHPEIARAVEVAAKSGFKSDNLRRRTAIPVHCTGGESVGTVKVSSATITPA